MGIVNCNLEPSSLLENNRWRSDYHLDPYDDVYLQTILRMDRRDVLKIPILSDDAFLSQFNELGNNTNGEFFSDEEIVCHCRMNCFFL